MITGVGVDVLSVDRIEHLLADEPAGARVRLFTEREVEEASAHSQPAIAFASLLAAKGAFFRALRIPCGSHSYKDVEVRADGPGRHRIVLRGVAAEIAARRGVEVLHVTLTRTAPWAAAVVVLAAGEVYPEACRA